MAQSAAGLVVVDHRSPIKILSIFAWLYLDITTLVTVI
jgi:hypothetical protein